MTDRKNTILIVDDNPTNINVLFETLSQHNYKVIIARNGKEALERAAMSEPSLILLDIMMPGMNGYEVCRKLKRDEKTSRAPVLFLTALSDTVDKVAGFEAGAVDYITKPFQAEEVLARINTHLTLVQLQSQLEDANIHLEEKVKERTSELASTNKLLREEIDERKKVQEELVEAKNEAEKADRLKSEFLAQMSHEIRTPLNAILNFSDIIQADYEEQIDEELADSLTILHGSGRRLLRTFSLILDFSQLKSESFDLTAKELDFYEDILLPCCTKQEKKAAEKGLDFRVENKVSGKRITGDPYLLNKIFDNIIGNAVIFTSEGGVTVTANGSDSGFEVQVADTGPGIAGDFLPSLFDPFLQEQQGWSRQFEGNGLGLALAKAACEIHNGTILVETEKGKGATFTVKLPAKAPIPT